MNKIIHNILFIVFLLDPIVFWTLLFIHENGVPYTDQIVILAFMTFLSYFAAFILWYTRNLNKEIAEEVRNN